MAIAIDPVCGMEVDTETATLTSEHEGTVYYFCGKGCKLDFDDDPETYLDPAYEPAGDVTPGRPARADVSVPHRRSQRPVARQALGEVDRDDREQDREDARHVDERHAGWRSWKLLKIQSGSVFTAARREDRDDHLVERESEGQQAAGHQRRVRRTGSVT